MTSILETVQALGIDGVIQGDEYLAACPAHKERTGSPDANPSWSINLIEGVHHCFSCQYGGSLRQLITQLVGEEEASDWSLDRISIDSGDLLARVTALETTIRVRPPASRGFPEASLDVFVPPPDWALEARDVLPKACHEMGTLWDARKNSWILVVRDAYQNILGWQVKSQRGPKVFRNWPAGMHKGNSLFGYSFVSQTLEARDELVVVESPLDAVRMYGFGIPTVAAYGARLSAAQLDLLKYHRVVLMPDNDDAGKQMALQVSRKLSHIKQVDYKGLPDRVDPGDLSERTIKRLLSQSRSTLAVAADRLSK